MVEHEIPLFLQGIPTRYHAVAMNYSPDRVAWQAIDRYQPNDISNIAVSCLLYKYMLFWSCKHAWSSLCQPMLQSLLLAWHQPVGCWLKCYRYSFFGWQSTIMTPSTMAVEICNTCRPCMRICREGKQIFGFNWTLCVYPIIFEHNIQFVVSGIIKVILLHSTWKLWVLEIFDVDTRN